MVNNFHVGQKVVCIDNKLSSKYSEGQYLQLNKIYNIREIHSSGGGIRLVEIVNAPRNFVSVDTKKPIYTEMWYGAARFKPLIEKKTDISIFTEILNKSTKVIENV